jgi:hypothetical protein
MLSRKKTQKAEVQCCKVKTDSSKKIKEYPSPWSETHIEFFRKFAKIFAAQDGKWQMEKIFNQKFATGINNIGGKFFSICQLHYTYLRECSKKFEMTLKLFSGT